MQQIAQKLIQIFYKALIKRFIFLFDPEKVHDRAVGLGEFFGNYAITRKITGAFFKYENEILGQNILNIKFKNPVGLAAGFDKNAELIKITGALGFGFNEVGSITGESCEGNSKPRLWRLVKSKGIIVWYGLKNDGAEKIYNRIKNISVQPNDQVPIGVSIARTNSKEIIGLEKEVSDCIKAFKIFQNFGDYFALNISCPNTCGGTEFHKPENLEPLLQKLSELKITKPIFIKMQPDLSKETIDKIIGLARAYSINGFIASNLTKKRSEMKINGNELEKIDPGKGGISGKPMEHLANNLIKYIYQKTRGEFVIIGCGGIFSAEDAYKKIRLGASLVQLITGMIFEGPQLIGQINYELAKLLKKDGFKNISEAVGIDTKI